MKVGDCSIEQHKPASEFKPLLLECLTYVVITIVACIFFHALIGV